MRLAEEINEGKTWLFFEYASLFPLRVHLRQVLFDGGPSCSTLGSLLAFLAFSAGLDHAVFAYTAVGDLFELG